MNAVDQSRMSSPQPTPAPSPDCPLGPAWRFTPLGWRDHAVCRSHFARGFLLLADAVTRGNPRRDLLQRAAMDSLKAGFLAYPSPEYFKNIRNPDNIVLLAWLSLKHHHPEVTPKQVEQLVTPHNWRPIHRLVVRLAGDPEATQQLP